VSLIRYLRRGGMVALVVDAGVNRGSAVPVRFFGRETPFPDGPARLARLTGSTLIFGIAVRRPGGRYLAFVCPPLVPDRAVAAESDIMRMTQSLASALEEFVRGHLSQWYAFREVWPDSDGVSLEQV
jgi:KDO2-lipid IV(A) lauroyltransferase